MAIGPPNPPIGLFANQVGETEVPLLKQILAAVIAGGGGGGGATIAHTTNLIAGDGAGNGVDSGIAASNVAVLNAANVFTASGAASVPVFKFTGTPYSAGDATTNEAMVLFQPTGATPATTWSTSGTFLGINAAAGGRDWFSFMTNGAIQMRATDTNLFLGNALNLHATLENYIALQQNGGNMLFVSNSSYEAKLYGGVALRLATALSFGSDAVFSSSGDTFLSRASAGVFRLDGAAVTTETVVSDTTLPININGTLYKFCLKA